MSGSRNRVDDLSRLVSHALRHEPWLYELELDEHGWTSVEDLVEALGRETGWGSLTAHDVQTMVASATKQRHEIVEDRIRASYGHSLPRPDQAPGRRAARGSLPRHVTPKRSPTFKVYGLRPMTRQYVHLSVDPRDRPRSGQPQGRRASDPDDPGSTGTADRGAVLPRQRQGLAGPPHPTGVHDRLSLDRGPETHQRAGRPGRVICTAQHRGDSVAVMVPGQQVAERRPVPDPRTTVVIEHEVRG